MASKPTLLGPQLRPRHHGTEKVLETVYSQFDHPMRLLTQEILLNSVTEKDSNYVSSTNFIVLLYSEVGFSCDTTHKT